MQKKGLSRIGLSSAAAGCLGLWLQAQSPVDRSDLGSELGRWLSAHGSAWGVREDRGTGHAAMIYGGKAAARSAPRMPRTDGEFLLAARGFIEDARGVLGIEGATLGGGSVMLLPLAAVGSTDKLVARFAQEWNGVPVERGFVDVLMAPGGDLLAMASTGIPDLAGLDTLPDGSAILARRFAEELFHRETGLPVTKASAAELNIVREKAGRVEAPVLSWRVSVMNETQGLAPEGWVYRLAAQGPLRVIRRDALVHHFDVGGTVVANATPGTLPDVAANPPQAEAMARMSVSAEGIGTTMTDAGGAFNFPGASGPVDVTVTFDGPFASVQNLGGSDYTLTQTLSGVGNTLVMNPTPSPLITAQANAFARIVELRELTRLVNPSDGMMDFVNASKVNVNSSCGAFYDGSSTSFFRSSALCVNTAYSTVIWHEQGHWQNDRYGSGNGADGFGEGNADVFAMYTADSPLIGEDFFGAGTMSIRDGRNLRQYCGDGNGGCYSNVFDNGEVLMGVLWKVRSQLEITHGAQLGGDIANALFFGWMNAFDQGAIDSVIEIQWLTLDDDDGNLANGTPNLAEIDAAFRAQGFPGFDPGGPAKATQRNGTGLDPAIFDSITLPITGTEWTSTIDAGSIGAAGPTFVLGFTAALDPGIVLGLGEVLVDPTSALLLADMSTVVGGTATHAVSVPADPSLVGLALFTQAFLMGVPGPIKLTNALDLCIGSF